MTGKQTVIADRTPLRPHKQASCVLCHVIGSTQMLFLHNLHHCLYYLIISSHFFKPVSPLRTAASPHCSARTGTPLVVLV